MPINVTGAFNFPAGATKATFLNDSYNVVDDFTLVRGRHQFGIGGNVGYWQRPRICPRRAPPAPGSSTAAPRASASPTCCSGASRRWSMVRSRICRCTAGISGCTRRIRGARPTG